MDILFVDDERDYLLLMEAIFEPTRIKLHCAGSGEEAVKAVKDKSFDLIFTDVNMPGMSGLELIRRLRKMGVDTPVVILTSHFSPVIYTQAMEAGATDIFCKETSLNGIVSIINKVTGDTGNLKISNGLKYKKLTNH